MQTKFISAGLMACTLFAGPAFAAGFQGQATLASPVSATSTTVVEGIEWTCQAATCAGVSDKKAGLDSQMKECRKVAAAIGPLSAYSSRGRAMSAVNLSVCNRLAAQKATDSQLATK